MVGKQQLKTYVYMDLGTGSVTNNFADIVLSRDKSNGKNVVKHTCMAWSGVCSFKCGKLSINARLKKYFLLKYHIITRTKIILQHAKIVFVWSIIKFLILIFFISIVRFRHICKVQKHKKQCYTKNNNIISSILIIYLKGVDRFTQIFNRNFRVVALIAIYSLYEGSLG